MNQMPSPAPCAARLFLLIGSGLLGAVPFAATGAGKVTPIKVNVDYSAIPAHSPFRVKVHAAAFDFHNSGATKVDADEQVIGVQFAIWNPGEKDLKVARGNFLLNGTRFDLFVVKEKTSQGLVVTVPAAKVSGITNYYVLSSLAKQLKHLDPSYSGVDKSLQELNVRLPVIKGVVTGPAPGAVAAKSAREKLSGKELGPKCAAFLAKGNPVCNGPDVKKYGQKYVDRCLQPYEKTAVEGNELKCAVMTPK